MHHLRHLLDPITFLMLFFAAVMRPAQYELDVRQSM